MQTEAQVRAMSEEAKVVAILDLQQQIATLTVRLTELEARLNKNVSMALAALSSRRYDRSSSRQRMAPPKKTALAR